MNVDSPTLAFSKTPQHSKLVNPALASGVIFYASIVFFLNSSKILFLAQVNRANTNFGFIILRIDSEIKIETEIKMIPPAAAGLKSRLVLKLVKYFKIKNSPDPGSELYR